MNWFKKLFAQLSEEEEGNIEQDYAEKPGNRQKQPTAKVAYQYPTGKFRFPLIPDEGSAEQSSKSQREKRETLKAQKPIERSETKKPELIKEKQNTKGEKLDKKSETEPKKSTQPKKKFEKVVNESKQPFHPTEFVSPIYGYKSRPHVQKRESYLPELELISTGTKEREPANSNYNPFETYTNESFKEAEESDKEKIYAFSDLLMEENQSQQTEKVKLKESEPSFEEVVIPNIPAEEDPPITENQRDEWGYHEVLDVEEKEAEVTEEIVEISETDQAEHEPAYEDKADTSFLDESAATMEQVIPVSPIKEQYNSETESRKESSKQQHIPFNVIMLKQDKRSLERKQQQTLKMQETKHTYYRKPSITMLSIPPQHSEDDKEWVGAQKDLLNETLHHFKVGAKVVKATQGPSVTQFEVQPEPGVKVNKITNLSDDIKLSLSARDIRMEAPIPGKNTIGIEVPNRVSKPVFIREIIRHPSFIQHTSPLTVALGLDISGHPVVLDLQKMPHGLIAGATGSGKSVCVNSIIMSLLFKSTPDEVKLLLIDPKMVELTPYNHIPHLVSPVITDVKAATAALKWAVEEMERRYELFVHAGVRDIGKYNEMAIKHKQEKLPYMVIIIDELADLMMVAPSDVEEAICRIAQKARACGMHLLIATQRPSVDVITGLIKANIPTRIAFSVSSQVDSRTIIDIGGAERLLGKGDMLLLENGAPKPIRVQGNFVSDEEIERAVNHVRSEQKPNYLFEQSELLKEAVSQDEDELFFEACQYVIEQNGASTSSLQRRFRIGYNRAARLMEMMEDHGVISGPKGSKPRDVLVTEDELISMQDSD